MNYREGQLEHCNNVFLCFDLIFEQTFNTITCKSKIYNS